MITQARRSLSVLLGVMLLASAPACSKSAGAETGTKTKNIKQLPADLVPAELLGLPTKQEDMAATLKGNKRAYIDAIGLYSFRKDDLLQATLQVSRFSDQADWKSAKFRGSVIRQIGGSVPKLVRVGNDDVYLSTGTKQTLAMWFRGRNLLVLAVREDYGQPRALLREALGIKL